VSPRITDAEILGVTESTITVAFAVEADADPVGARVVVGGQVRATVAPASGVRLVRIDGLDPATEYDVTIEADGAPAVELDYFFPGKASTMPAPVAAEVASFGTVSDLHFGEQRFAFPGVPGDSLSEQYTQAPYWQFMSDGAVEDINASGVDAAIVKGDIADRGTSEQFVAAAATFNRFSMPWHAFLGNHDYYWLNDGGDEIDGYALLGQPPAPRRVDLAGWTLLLADSVAPGKHRGAMTAEMCEWLSQALADSAGRPTLVVMHHQPVPPEFSSGPINKIGIQPDDTVRLFATLAPHAHLKGVLIGHTHRNRVRRYAQVPNVPFAEVCCTKDYPGGWGHYRLFEDGTFRQEVRRISTPFAALRPHVRRQVPPFRDRIHDRSLLRGRLISRSSGCARCRPRFHNGRLAWTGQPQTEW
jgi:hypothetical protein